MSAFYVKSYPGLAPDRLIYKVLGKPGNIFYSLSDIIRSKDIVGPGNWATGVRCSRAFNMLEQSVGSLTLPLIIGPV